MTGEFTMAMPEGWRRSTRCEAGNCVEVARATDAVRVRNSTQPADELVLSHEQWRGFLAFVRGDGGQS
jgi:hypothetical protein